MMELKNTDGPLHNLNKELYNRRAVKFFLTKGTLKSYKNVKEKEEM